MIIGSNIHKCSKVEMGDNKKPIIFTHIGLPSNPIDLDSAINEEKAKIDLAIQAGTDIICDVSMNQDISYVQKEFIKYLSVPFATVSIYEAYINLPKDINKLDSTYFLKIIEEECQRGVDLITLHATVFKDDRTLLNRSKRLIPSTSRGGILMLELLEKYQIENPYFTHFNEVLDICKKYNVSISLGPCYRPASIVDCSLSDLHLLELKRMRKLCKMALKEKVNIMIEGIGHASIDKIPTIVKKSKKICYGVPYRVMTVANDISIGYDHISSAIAASQAIYAGADSVTCVTRSEHLGIPTISDVYEGVIAAKIASYSGYIARTKDYSKDYIMSTSRKKEGCIGDLSVCLFPETVKEYFLKNPNEKCTMCGEYCPLKKQRGDSDGIL